MDDMAIFRVVGEVLFNSSIPDEPPDFIFGDTNFLPDIDNVQVLEQFATFYCTLSVLNIGGNWKHQYYHLYMLEMIVIVLVG